MLTRGCDVSLSHSHSHNLDIIKGSRGYMWITMQSSPKECDQVRSPTSCRIGNPFICKHSLQKLFRIFHLHGCWYKKDIHQSSVVSRHNHLRPHDQEKTCGQHVDNNINPCCLYCTIYIHFHFLTHHLSSNHPPPQPSLSSMYTLAGFIPGVRRNLRHLLTNNTEGQFRLGQTDRHYKARPIA